MANWSDPGLNSNYATVLLPGLKDRDVDAATMCYNTATNPPTGMMKWVRANNKFQEYDGNNWNDKVLAVAGGGTGGANATDARTNLGIGSLGTQSSNNVSITGGSISGIGSFNTAGNISAGGTIQTSSAANDALKSGGGITLNDLVMYRSGANELNIAGNVTIAKPSAATMLVVQSPNGYQTTLRIYQTTIADWYVYLSPGNSSLRFSAGGTDRLIIDAAGNGNFYGSLTWGGGQVFANSNSVALSTHNHTGTYAPLSHTHNKADITDFSHTHTEYVPKSELAENTTSNDYPVVYSLGNNRMYHRRDLANDTLYLMHQDGNSSYTVIIQQGLVYST